VKHVRSSRPPRGRGDDGAALVEFAIVAAPLFLIIFGIIEFGWAFAQHLDVRHGARETSRLVAVNYKANPASTGTTQSDEIIAEACDRMDGGESVELDVTSTAIGQPATVEVSKDLDTLTGFLDFALPDSVQLRSSVETRIEQTASWVDRTGAC
jgi:Flp pilus assembly protein TadG